MRDCVVGVRQDTLQSLLLDRPLILVWHPLIPANLSHATGKPGMTFPFRQRQQQAGVKKTHPYS
jgi:hypothetical protein